MMKNLSQQLDPESLRQLSKEELASIILEQASIISELQKIISELRQEIKRLKVSRDLNSQTDIVTPVKRPAEKARKKETRGGSRTKHSQAKTRRTTRTPREDKKRIWSCRPLRNTAPPSV